MDSFGEQLVAKVTTGADIAKKLGIMIGSGVLAAVIIILSVLAGVGIIAGVIVAVVIVAAAFWLLVGTNIEYEYIVTNEDIDIDKILGKRQRKRLITLKLGTAEDFGIYDGSQGEGVDATVVATDGTGINAYYLIAKHKTHGRTMVIFSPNEKIRNLIIDKLPPKLRSEIKLSKGNKTEE